jgi:hypothetical protein
MAGVVTERVCDMSNENVLTPLVNALAIVRSPGFVDTINAVWITAVVNKAFGSVEELAPVAKPADEYIARVLSDPTPADIVALDFNLRGLDSLHRNPRTASLIRAIRERADKTIEDMHAFLREQPAV